MLSLIGCATAVIQASTSRFCDSCMTQSWIWGTASQAVAVLFLRLYTESYGVGLVFFGFYCFLIGCLYSDPHFLPRVPHLDVIHRRSGLAYVSRAAVRAEPAALDSLTRTHRRRHAEHSVVARIRRERRTLEPFRTPKGRRNFRANQAVIRRVLLCAGFALAVCIVQPSHAAAQSDAAAATTDSATFTKGLTPQHGLLRLA